MFIVLFAALALIVGMCCVSWLHHEVMDKSADVLKLRHIQGMIEECPRLSFYVEIADMDGIITVNEYNDLRAEYADLQRRQALRNIRNTY